MMNWRGEPVEPGDIGEPLAWTDDDIDALVGIDEAGNVNPEVLMGAFDDAQRFPDLYALLTADNDDGNESD